MPRRRDVERALGRGGREQGQVRAELVWLRERVLVEGQRKEQGSARQWGRG